MCIPDPRPLYWRTNNVCAHRVERVDQMPLTDNPPHLERDWKVSGLDGGQADTMSIAEGADKQK